MKRCLVRVIVPVLLIVELSSIILMLLSYNNKDKLDINKISLNDKIEKFAIYKELTQGGNDWVVTSDTSFPNKGYILNNTKTECHSYNGEIITNALTQNDDMSITISSNKAIYCEAYFDKDDEKPVVSKFEIIGKDSQNQELRNGYTYQYGIKYEIGWEANDVKEYCVSSSKIECNGIWTKTNSLTDITTEIINLPDGEGLKTMYLFIKDRANNISETTYLSTKEIVVDRTAPTVKLLALTGTSISWFLPYEGYTHTIHVNYKITWDNEDVVNMCVNNEEVCDNYIKINGSKEKSGSLDIQSGDGEKIVYAYLKDNANNISKAKTSTIILDTVGPSVNVTEKNKTESSITINIEATDKNQIDSRYCQNPLTNEWITADSKTGDCTIEGLEGDTKYTIITRTYDKSGYVTVENAPEIKTDLAYICQDGVRVYDAEKGSSSGGYICTVNANDKNWKSTSTYWTCSNDNEQYESQSSALSACTNEEKGTCTSKTIVDCPSGYVQSGNVCHRSGECTQITSNRWKCSLLPDYFTSSSECTRSCGEEYHPMSKKTYVCDIKDFSGSEDECDKNCFIESIGEVNSVEKVVYYCDNGWNEYSGSGSSLVCYKAAIRG